MNKKDYRYQKTDSNFKMSIGSKSYTVTGSHREKDPFVKRYEELSEKIRKEKYSIEDILTKEMKSISNQAYLAQDPLVLQSVFRMINKAQDVSESPEFGQQFLNNLMLPASVKVLKRNFFLSPKPLEKVEVFQKDEKLGETKTSKFNLLPGNYKFKHKGKEIEEKILDHQEVVFQTYELSKD